jgi:hypothetical protein
MEVGKNVSLIISLPKGYRDHLRRMAAEINLTNQDVVSSAARLGREIIVNHINSIAGENHHDENRTE